MADQPNNVFSDEPTPVVPPVSQAPSNAYATLLSSIKNEDGAQKYDSIEKALEALGHSQQFIPQIKSQLTEREQRIAALEAELASRESLDATIQKLIVPKEQPGEVHQPTANGLDEQAVTNLVSNYLSQKERAGLMAGNEKQVQDALVAKYGDKVGEVVDHIATTNGITKKRLGELAAENPKLVLALFNTPGDKTPRMTTGGMNMPAIASHDTDLKPPAKSLLSGATAKDQKAYWKQIEADVYARNGITS